MANEQTQNQELYAQVVEKAWMDSDFKKGLIANPVYVIKKEFGATVHVPQGKTLVVLDQSEFTNIEQEDDKSYFVIPENTQKELELTEEELEIVSGGGITFVAITDKYGNLQSVEWHCTIP